MRRQRRRGLQPHSRSKTLARSREVGVIDLEHLRCFIPCCLLISDVIIHPIHPSIIAHTRIFGSFLLSFTISTSYPCAHDFHLSLPQFCPVFTHPLTQPHVVCLFFPCPKKDYNFQLMSYFAHARARKPKGVGNSAKNARRGPAQEQDQRMD